MKLSIFLLISLFSGVAFSSFAKECSKPSDCGPHECCVLGMERYSIPQCKKKGRQDSWCRTEAVPEDRMLYYPNQDIKEVTGVYTLFCPCEDGFICDRSKCKNPNATNEKIPNVRFPFQQ